MLTYSLHTSSKIPLYEQLYQAIKTDILEGKLKANEKLPSKRNFSKHLGISVVTIETSYQQLQAEGLIYSLPKKGFFVAQIQVQRVKSEKRIRLVSDLYLRSEYPKTKFNLGSNQINPETFPFATWSKLLRSVLNDNQEQLVEPSPSQGVLELRQAIASHLNAYRGMAVDPQQIVIGAGTDYLYLLLIQLLGPEKTVAIENPGYPKIKKIYEQFKVSYQFLPVQKDGIDLASLNESTADIVHISPSHQFPTGAILPISKRYELLAWASQKKDRFIIEDDFDSEFRFGGKPLPSLQEIDHSDRVIYINTFSKSLVSTLRISYMILPPQLLPLFQERLDLYSNTVSNLEQYTLAKFIKDGYFEKHLNRMRLYYQRKRDDVIKNFKESSLSEYISIINSSSGLHFIIEMKTTIPEHTICQRALEHDLSLIPVSYFYHEENTLWSNCFIVNYSNIKSVDITNIISILENILQEK
ncbi:TPA: PLP-dependent aminotransferase family protein [Streptococcus suis]